MTSQVMTSLSIWGGDASGDLILSGVEVSSAVVSVGHVWKRSSNVMILLVVPWKMLKQSVSEVVFTRINFLS